VFPSAPAVAMRGNFINAVFQHNEQGLTFLIGENCGKSINDYMYLKEDSDGTKAKIKKRDKETGVTAEEYGHTSDANDYLICYAFQSEYTSYQKGGKSVKVTTGSNYSKNSF
jgi:phage terminase large subunit